MSNQNLDLYHLIKNSNSTEKAYFKKFGFKYIKGVNPEIELFDLINKQLNKNEINKQLDNKTKIAFKDKFAHLNFTKQKNSLFKRILESLAEYDKKDNERSKVIQQYNDANVLLKRNLPKAAIRIINKAKARLEHNEDLLFGILFDELDFTCSVVLNNKERIKETYESRYTKLDELNAQLDLAKIYEDVFHLYRIQGVDREGEIKEELKIINLKVENINLEGKSYKFKFNYYSLLKTIAYLKNENAVFALEKMVDIIQLIPHMFNQKDILVIGTYADLIVHEIEENNNNYYYKKYYKTIKSWENSQPNIISYATTQALRVKITSLVFEQKFDEVVLLEKDYLESKNDFSQLLQLATNDCFILSFYCLNNYKKVIEYANYQFEIKDLRLDIQLSTEFILLVLQYEDQEFDVLQNNIKSITNRMKSKEDSILKNENTILKFFKNTVSPKKKPDIEMAQIILNELQSNQYKSLSNSFDFTIWFQALINKTNYKVTLLNNRLNKKKE